ncbi:O-antigen ligase family protein [Anaerocolumna chitinilytica]|uniref:O-antigen ligase-related domain-containing protein n=1 Tax=Anaerocolumna chitinilytica TaxID=1727145 RepID=A0A7I8DG40_9FIRM|nr:O-antigen ligase family protein [Anaerocolumna chitinilytica]BCJ97362.1 hypothetical protein bsdcttw_04030 [Anaerocolumna chitinilytica]
MKEINSSIVNNKLMTNIFLGTIVLILLLQNGPLHNMPIILIIIPIFFCGQKFVLLVGKNEKYVIYYGLYLLAVTLFNINKNYDLNYTINLLLQYLLIYISVKIVIQKINKKDVLLFFRNIGIVISLLCLPEAITGVHFIANFLGKQLGSTTARVVSIFNHPIICGCFLVITLILIIVYPLKKYSYQIILVSIILVAIVLTQSRSAWLATAISLLAYFVRFHKNKINKKYLIYTCVFIGLIVTGTRIFNHNLFFVIWSFIYNRLNGSFEAGEGHIVRIEIILNAVDYWKENIFSFIFGNGKNYGLLFMKNNPIHKFGTFTWDSAVDNQYITLIFETGIIGLLFIINIILINVKRFVRANKEDKEGIAVSLCLIGNSVCLFFFEGFNYPVLVLVFLIMIFIGDDNARIHSKEIQK